MSEQKQPNLRKLLTFFQEAPKKSLDRTKSLFILHNRPQPTASITSFGKLKLFFHKSVPLIKQRTKERLEHLSITVIQSVPQSVSQTKESSLQRFGLFFKRASDLVQANTLQKLENCKRALTAVSKKPVENNSSLAMSQANDILIDKNAASFANMTLELSINTHNYQPNQFALPSRDTNRSQKELNFDLTVPIEENQEPPNGLDESNLDDVPNVLGDELQQRQISSNPERSSIGRLINFFVAAPKSIQAKNNIFLAKSQSLLQGEKALKNKENTRKLKGFIQAIPFFVRKKTSSFLNAAIKGVAQMPGRQVKPEEEKSPLTEVVEMQKQVSEENPIQVSLNPVSDERNDSQLQEYEMQQNQFPDYDGSSLKQDSMMNSFENKKFQPQEITHIRNKSHQDSYYSETSQIIQIIDPKNNQSDLSNQGKILINENTPNESEVSYKNAKNELLAEVQEIDQEIQQLRQKKREFVRSGKKLQLVPFKPNYKKLAEIADDNEAIYRAKALVKRMNFERKLKDQREKQKNDKLDQYFQEIYQIKYAQEESKQRYEEKKKQQIQDRIDRYQRKREEFQQLQKIGNSFVRKLIELGPQRGKLANEFDLQVGEIKGVNRKVNLKSIGIIELPKIQQRKYNLFETRYMNEELAVRSQEEMLKKYEESKLRNLKEKRMLV